MCWRLWGCPNLITNMIGRGGIKTVWVQTTYLYSVHLLSSLYLHVGVKICKLRAFFFNFFSLIFADVKDFAGITSVLAGVSCAYNLLFRVSGYKALFSGMSSISGFPWRGMLVCCFGYHGQSRRTSAAYFGWDVLMVGRVALPYAVAHRSRCISSRYELSHLPLLRQPVWWLSLWMYARPFMFLWISGWLIRLSAVIPIIIDV